MQDSLPAGGLRLCRAGVEPAGSLRTVSARLSPPFLFHPPFRGLPDASWAHLRRKFYDLHISGVSQTATDTIVAMTELWKVEDEVRGKDAGTRARRRQETSSVIVTSLFELWEKELGKVSGKSKTAEAIRYALTRREALERFLMDGRIEIDSNIVERAIRPQTITRKNSLFAGSEGGGRTWATLATLLQTCRMNSVDPLNWLSQTLTRIAQGWPVADIEALMPWNFKPDAIG